MEDQVAVAVVGGRGRLQETLVRGSSDLEEGITVGAEGRNARRVERIQNCLAWVETAIVETVEIVVEIPLEGVAVVAVVAVATIQDPAPVASALHRHFTTTDRPRETVEVGMRLAAPGATLLGGIVDAGTCTAPHGSPTTPGHTMHALTTMGSRLDTLYCSA